MAWVWLKLWITYSLGVLALWAVPTREIALESPVAVAEERVQQGRE